MNLYAHDYADHLANSLASFNPDVHKRPFTWGRFRNGELFVRLLTPDSGHCLAMGGVHPPEERLATYLLLCDTLKRSGAKALTAILPYLGYSRQDKVESGGSLAAAWVGALLQASGVDDVLTIDLHSSHVPELFPIPLTSVSAAVLFAEAIGIVDDCTTIVAPDEGGRVRCELLNRALECGRPVIYCRKVRTAKSVTSELVGVPTERAIVYDDILDTGDTLVACCERLVEAGAKRISVFATHGLFTGSNWHRLWELNVERITCTDSVPGSLPPDARIFSIDCAPTLSAALESVADPKEFAHV